MNAPDTTLRAVEIGATIGGVKRLTDGSASIYIKSSLEYSKAEFWPLSLLQGEAATVLIQPDNIGKDADAQPLKPKGTKGGSASQLQRQMLEEIGRTNGVTEDKIEQYYQRRMDANLARLNKELEAAQQKGF